MPTLHVSLHISPQTPGGGGVHYTNLTSHGEGKKEAITFKATVTKIKLTCTGGPVGPPTSTTVGGGNCFLFTGEASYSGEDYATGYVDNGGTGGTTPSGLNEGAQVDLTTV